MSDNLALKEALARLREARASKGMVEAEAIPPLMPVVPSRVPLGVRIEQ